MVAICSAARPASKVVTANAADGIVDAATSLRYARIRFSLSHPRVVGIFYYDNQAFKQSP